MIRDSHRIILCILALVPGIDTLRSAPVHLVDQQVVEQKRLEDGTLLLDFGKVAFGNLKVDLPQAVSGPLRFHFGEAFSQGRVNRKPPGTVRYAVALVETKGGEQVIVAPPADKRNTRQPKAVLTPEEWGVVLPFRWVEVEGWEGEMSPDSFVRQAAFLSAWNDESADFRCSDPMLNRIWDLCKYSIKATTFAGVYVDGDRERIPYEADAYINQLAHYYSDADKEIARDTFDWLMEKPTWPTEWGPHMVLMAYADWMYTADLDWLGKRYESLKSKMLMDRVGPQGWVRSNERQIRRDDIVDWPKNERDGFVFKEVNTVVNAFHLKVLKQMSEMADALGKKKDAEEYIRRYEEGAVRFNEALWMPGEGRYRDGLGTDHSSAHANLFPLAFGLVPEANRKQVVEFLKSKGMACSVYAAQYLMEGLFENGAAEFAIELMVVDNDRSWRHMVESGTTITWEAWDQKYKPNQDWNHAWGAAPANLLPRYVLGVEPITPGWDRTRIAPRLGGLSSASGTIPTGHGSLEVAWRVKGNEWTIELNIPEGMTVDISLPDMDQTVRQGVSAGSHTIVHSLKP